MAVRGFQSFYYVENRAPMSSRDVTGLLVGLPKAGLIFLYSAPLSEESVSAFLNMQNTQIYTHNNVYTQQKRQCPLTEAPTATGWTQTGPVKWSRSHVRSPSVTPPDADGIQLA